MELLKFFRDMESGWTVKNDKPHYGHKEHTSVDINHGFVLATTTTPASHHDSPYLAYYTAASCHTKQTINKVYADKGYYGEPNRTFLHLNRIEDGMVRKDMTTAKLTVHEEERNKKVSKRHYIVEQYFGVSNVHDGAFRTRFTTIAKNIWDAMYRQLAFNLFRGSKIIIENNTGTHINQLSGVPGYQNRDKIPHNNQFYGAKCPKKKNFSDF